MPEQALLEGPPLPAQPAQNDPLHSLQNATSRPMDEGRSGAEIGLQFRKLVPDPCPDCDDGHDQTADDQAGHQSPLNCLGAPLI